MPSQWELETAERLGGIDAKLDQVLKSVPQTERRIGSLERTRSYAYGWFAGATIVIIALAWVVANVKG